MKPVVIRYYLPSLAFNIIRMLSLFYSNHIKEPEGSVKNTGILYLCSSVSTYSLHLHSFLSFTDMWIYLTLLLILFEIDVSTYTQADFVTLNELTKVA